MARSDVAVGRDMTKVASPTERRGNFSFLAEHSPLLADLGATAEKLYPFDPSSCVLKLRVLAELLTQEVAFRIGLRLQQPTQAELLRAVDQRLGLDAQVRQMFHLLRLRGFSLGTTS